MKINISRYVRVTISEQDIEFLKKHKDLSSFLQSQLSPEEHKTAKILSDKCILVRKKLNDDTQYAVNKNIKLFL